MMTGPRLRLLSLGAGMQSTTVLLLACDGTIPRFDYAVFADTRWEPAAVYANLRRLRLEAAEAGIAVLKVCAGDIRADALDPVHRFASMPLFVKGPNGERGMARRQCTSEYKVRPLKAKARELPGYPHPSRVPKGVYAAQAIGISTDEFHRAKDSGVNYLKNTFPLIELGWTRGDCIAYLRRRGWDQVARSSCVGCPFHGNHTWRRMRDERPAEWAAAVAFDYAIRKGHPAANTAGQPPRGEYFIHHSRVALDLADLRPRRGGDGADPDGCSPWGCRSGHPTPESAREGSRVIATRRYLDAPNAKPRWAAGPALLAGTPGPAAPARDQRQRDRYAVGGRGGAACDPDGRRAGHGPARPRESGPSWEGATA